MSKIFVSSSYTDLVAYRDLVLKGIRQSGNEAVGMEDFGARDARPLTECLAVIEKSDIFVGIYARRYGFVPEGSKISITEAEYRHAIDKSLPVFAYLLDPKQPWPSVYTDEGELEEQLNRFKDLLRKNHIVKEFKNEFQLGYFVANDLLRQFNREGLSDARPLLTAGASAVPLRTKTMKMPTVSSPGNLEEWNNERYSIYNKTKDLFLHYDVEASNVSGQKFDIAIYLIRQSKPDGSGRDDLHDVERVEFFFGPHWGNKLYTVQNIGGRIGIITSAYGEFLAYCKVYIKGDPRPVDLHQFIRFPDAASP
jgi:Domain of unknown function (DUF4062)